MCSSGDEVIYEFWEAFFFYLSFTQLSFTIFSFDCAANFGGYFPGVR